MSRWDRRSDEGQYYQQQRDDVRHGSNRARGSSRSRSRSPETRTRSRSPSSQQSRHHHPASYREQRNHHRHHQQEEEERRRRQEALDSRGGGRTAAPNGTASGPGGTKPGVATKPKGPVTGIQMKLAAPSSKEPPRLMKPVANAFRLADDSDDSEPEEMPAECRMRMRNIGRDTPTSSGPNSFGKTKHGFCDSKKMFEKKIGSSLGDR
uniref:PEST proteolytic signal-containing nuclear protein n=1 Tax=Anopheles farauti TaxID=69004 RepID=A0A182QRV6_9DIPT